MTKLKETAQAYEPKQIKNIAELEFVSVDEEIFKEEEADFPYSYILREEKRYKVPVSVISSLKELLEDSSDLKKFKVKKTGEGMKTSYTVIPIV